MFDTIKFINLSMLVVDIGHLRHINNKNDHKLRTKNDKSKPIIKLSERKYFFTFWHTSPVTIRRYKIMKLCPQHSFIISK